MKVRINQTMIPRDSIVTCTKGHPIYRFVRDVLAGERNDADQLEPVYPRLKQPYNGEEIVLLCPHPRCEDIWATFESIDGQNVVCLHLEDGWWKN